MIRLFVEAKFNYLYLFERRKVGFHGTSQKKHVPIETYGATQDLELIGM